MEENFLGIGGRSAVAGGKRRLPEIIRDRILLDIYSSKIPAGKLYATESELALKLGVSRNTVRFALGELERAGYVARRQRRGVIITEKSCPPPGSAAPGEDADSRSGGRSEAARVILVLPSWDSGTGNFYSNFVLRELSGGGDRRKFIVEVRLFDDPLDDIAGDTGAVLAVDPAQEIFGALERLAGKGVKIIAVEPKFPMRSAVNIRFDIYRGSYDSVKLLYDMGHRKIGLANSSIAHDTFRQWLCGYIDAHRDLSLSIVPGGLAQGHSENFFPAPDLRNTTAWICAFRAGMEAVARGCAERGLSIPADVSLICSDDPGDTIVPAVGRAVTVCRPDYVKLSRMIRDILCHQTVAVAGSCLQCPVTWIERGTVTRREEAM
jgi:DNA-binding transcriptional ArsR family regulator